MKYKLNPSDADVWVNCPASAHLNRKEEEVSKEQEEGINSHKKIEMAILGKDNGETTSSEEEYVLNYIRKLKEYNFLMDAELRVSPFEGVNGRIDLVATDCGNHKTKVIDYKFGWDEVEAKNNYALILYALGVIKLLEDELAHVTEEFELIILQPNSERKEKVWRVPKQELYDKWRPFFEKAVNKAKEGVEFKPGKHCKKCSYKGNCQALAAYLEPNVRFMTKESKIDKLSNEKINEFLTLKKLIIGWLEALEEEGLRRVKAGEILSDFVLGRGRSNRTWTDAGMVEHVLQESGMDMEKVYSKTLLSPAQMEKVLKGNAELKHAIKLLEIKPQGREVLKPLSMEEAVEGFEDLSKGF